MTDDVAGLVERLRESAAAFLKYPIYTQDGDHDYAVLRSRDGQIYGGITHLDHLTSLPAPKRTEHFVTVQNSAIGLRAIMGDTRRPLPGCVGTIKLTVEDGKLIGAEVVQ